MKLRFGGGSPFVRKVTVSAIETGLDDRIERVPTDHRDPNDPLHQDNPLGKVPAMTLDDGRVLIESSIICAHLDTLHDGPKLIPADGDAHHEALFLEAVAGGMTDAAIAVQRERGRPEDKQWAQFSDRQWGKVESALDVLEGKAGDLNGP
ncbi:MAG: glutathione S-transferase family protein, partial [Alphaproteobacteria bacterium]